MLINMRIRPRQNADIEDAKPIMNISCEGTDDELVRTVIKFEDDISKLTHLEMPQNHCFTMLKKLVLMWEAN